MAGTLGFTTFVFYQCFNFLNVRSRNGSGFSRHSFTNRSLWISLVLIVVLQALVVHLPVPPNLFTTTSLPPVQLRVGVAAGSTVLWA